MLFKREVREAIDQHMKGKFVNIKIQRKLLSQVRKESFSITNFNSLIELLCKEEEYFTRKCYPGNMEMRVRAWKMMCSNNPYHKERHSTAVKFYQDNTDYISHLSFYFAICSFVSYMTYVTFFI
jgi:hypothetical protein